MLVIGLTGGIGSGKSTVAQLFAKYNAPIIDTDRIARDITKPNTAAFSALIAHFGKAILLKDGTLDRAALRNIIFNDSKQRRFLENRLHPLIRDAVERQLKTLTVPYCIVVIPLLIEVKPYPFIDRILVVDAKEHLQIERTVLRDYVLATDVERILTTQAPRQEKLKQADDIIINNGTLAELVPQVERLHRGYLKYASMKKNL